MQETNSRHIVFILSGLVITMVSVFLLLRNAGNFVTMEESSPTLSSVTVIPDEIRNKSKQFIPYQAYPNDIKKKGDNQQYGDSNSMANIKDELKNAKTLPRLQLDLRLAGTILQEKESSYALIVDETSGKQNLYKVGASVKGAKLLKIGNKSAIFEKEGKSYILKVVKRNSALPHPEENLAKYGPQFTGISEELPFFEPVSNKTGPLTDSEGFYEKLPEFEPFENDSGPLKL